MKVWTNETTLNIEKQIFFSPIKNQFKGLKGTQSFDVFHKITHHFILFTRQSIFLIIKIFPSDFWPEVLNIQFFYCFWRFEDGSLHLGTLNICSSGYVRVYSLSEFYSLAYLSMRTSFFFAHWMFKGAFLYKANSCVRSIWPCSLFSIYIDQ